jgi:hypothetical protein
VYRRFHFPTHKGFEPFPDALYPPSNFRVVGINAGSDLERAVWQYYVTVITHFVRVQRQQYSMSTLENFQQIVTFQGLRMLYRNQFGAETIIVEPPLPVLQELSRQIEDFSGDDFMLEGYMCFTVPRQTSRAWIWYDNYLGEKSYERSGGYFNSYSEFDEDTWPDYILNRYYAFGSGTNTLDLNGTTLFSVDNTCAPTGLYFGLSIQENNGQPGLYNRRTLLRAVFPGPTFEVVAEGYTHIPATPLLGRKRITVLFGRNAMFLNGFGAEDTNEFVATQGYVLPNFAAQEVYAPLQPAQTNYEVVSSGTINDPGEYLSRQPDGYFAYPPSVVRPLPYELFPGLVASDYYSYPFNTVTEDEVVVFDDVRNSPLNIDGENMLTSIVTGDQPIGGALVMEFFSRSPSRRVRTSWRRRSSGVNVRVNDKPLGYSGGYPVSNADNPTAQQYKDADATFAPVSNPYTEKMMFSLAPEVTSWYNDVSAAYFQTEGTSAPNPDPDFNHTSGPTPLTPANIYPARAFLKV